MENSHWLKGDKSVIKGKRASADWRSETQACFRKTAVDFLDAKFQNMLLKVSSPFFNKGQHASDDRRSEKQACFRKTAVDFLMQNSKTCYRKKILETIVIVVDECHCVRPSEYILRILPVFT